MLSDDSSSDSETGRFKSNAKPERSSDNQISQSKRRNEPLPDIGKSRNHDRAFGRSYDRRNEDRGRFERRRSRDRYDSIRRPPSPRRRFSRERSYERRSYRENTEHVKHRDDKDRDFKRSSDTDKKRSCSPRGSQPKRNFKDEIKKNIIPLTNDRLEIRKKSEEKIFSTKDKTKEHCHSSSDKDKHKKFDSEKRCSKQKIENVEIEQRSSKSRTYAEEVFEEEKPASYYNLVPAKDEFVVIDETVHQVTDSSEDEEKLRAKLLNLEKQLDKTKKKKSKKSKKKSKSKHKESADLVEVSSTTDIQELEDNGIDRVSSQPECIEVTSTQTMVKKETSEEGELSTEDESSNVPIDPSDLRHRLKKATADTSDSPNLRDKLKPKLEIAGPALPPHLQRKMEQRSPTPETEGPALPPHLKKDKNIGPTIPEKMRVILAESAQDYKEQYVSSEDEGIGPLPLGAEEKWKDSHKRLEERALLMKINKLEGCSSKTDVKSREEWMLELPEAKAKHIGLGPRQFRAREAPDMTDRSSWTDTPKEKALKAAGMVPADEASTTVLQREAHNAHLAERDQDQEKAVKKHKKKHKREESLLEIHQKKLKKKKKKEEKEEGGKTRRPFDRDIDLQANRFDDAQKRSIIKKAQLLDTRFSAGHAKYL